MLHILAGYDLVRAHGGILYTYDDGAFHGYKGVVSEAVLSRCKSYLKRLEGMFSCLPSLYQVEKNEVAFVDVLAVAFTAAVADNGGSAVEASRALLHDWDQAASSNTSDSMILKLSMSIQKRTARQTVGWLLLRMVCSPESRGEGCCIQGLLPSVWMWRQAHPSEEISRE